MASGEHHADQHPIDQDIGAHDGGQPKGTTLGVYCLDCWLTARSRAIRSASG